MLPGKTTGIIDIGILLPSGEIFGLNGMTSPWA
jgi:hypothetical protein